MLDVYNCSTADGGAIVQWADDNGTNQQFRLADSDGGYVRLINRNSGKAVEVQGASTADGAQRRAVRRLGRHQPAVAARPGRRPSPHRTTADRARSRNPVVWQDFADGDIIRVGDAYYYSASTMHYSPGAPILRSYDLVNWEYAGHSVPSLDFGSNAYDLNGGRAYVKGIWASTLNYRPSNSTYYWVGCVEFNRTYVYTAAGGRRHLDRSAPQINNCYYDAGLLIDDNDTMYVAYGNTHHQRRPAVRRRAQPGPGPAGLPDAVEHRHAGGRPVLQAQRQLLHLADPPGQRPVRAASRSSPFGPYEMRQVLLNLPGPISGGGVPHQGGLVQTPERRLVLHGLRRRLPRRPGAGARPDHLDRPTAGRRCRPSTARWGATYPKPNIPHHRARSSR